MRRFGLVAVLLSSILLPGVAWAVTSSSKVVVGDGGTPIASATVTLTRVVSRTAPKPRTPVPRAPARTDPTGATTLIYDTEDTGAAFNVTVRTAAGRTYRLTNVKLDDILRNGIDVRTAPVDPPLRNARTASPVETVPDYPGAGGIPISVGRSFTQVPRVSGGTLVGVGFELPLVTSRHVIPGESGTVGLVVPNSTPLWGDYFVVDGGFNTFDDSVQGGAPIGTASAFTYLFPNPISGSTGIGPTATGQNVTLNTKGQFWDIALGSMSRIRIADTASPSPRDRVFFSYGFGVRYRHMNVEHTITQQSLTFADLTNRIGLDLTSDFIGPNFAVGVEVVQPLPSGSFAGGTAFFAPGALITSASASQFSRCGPCGVASPEFALALQRNFDDTSFAFMSGVNGFIGYRFNPNVKVQAEGSLNYLSRVMSFAVPTSPTNQPVRLVDDSSVSYWVGGRLVIDLNPTPARMRTAP